MKKFCSLFCVVAMLLSLILLPTSAAGADGLRFDGNYRYQNADVLEKAPHTFSGWISVPKDFSKTGVLYGNYMFGYKGYLNFEVQHTGYPKISYTGADGETHSLVFNKVNLKTGIVTYLTLVHDPEKGEARCYINGQLKQTIEATVDYSANALSIPFSLGGDSRPANYAWFRGEIKQVSVYATARTDAEVAEDYTSASKTADNLIAYYRVNADNEGEDIEDLSENGNDLKSHVVWINPADQTPITNAAYSFAVIGDTQDLLYHYPDDFHYVYDWILANKESKNIQYVFGLGDITDKDTVAEWDNAISHIKRLDGVIPHSHIRGNHDGITNYTKYFDYEAYTGQFEGFYSRNLTSSWRTFDVGNDRYLMINLDYNCSDDVLRWACDIVEEHPDRKVIITTHGYMDHNKELSHAQLWNKLASQYENIFLVMNGHHGSDENIVWRQSEGVHGNTVTEILIDPQEIDQYGGATGMVALLHFYENGNKISVEYVSTVKGEYYKEINQFDIILSEEIPVEPDTKEPETEFTTDTEAPTTPETQPPVDTPDSTGCSSVVFGMTGMLSMVGIAAVMLKNKKEKRNR